MSVGDALVQLLAEDLHLIVEHIFWRHTRISIKEFGDVEVNDHLVGETLRFLWFRRLVGGVLVLHLAIFERAKSLVHIVVFEDVDYVSLAVKKVVVLIITLLIKFWRVHLDLSLQRLARRGVALAVGQELEFYATNVANVGATESLDVLLGVGFQNAHRREVARSSNNRAEIVVTHIVLAVVDEIKLQIALVQRLAIRRDKCRQKFHAVLFGGFWSGIVEHNAPRLRRPGLGLRFGRRFFNRFFHRQCVRVQNQFSRQHGHLKVVTIKHIHHSVARHTGHCAVVVLVEELHFVAFLKIHFAFYFFIASKLVIFAQI